MKYMLMMGSTKAGWDTFGAWPKKDIQAHIAFMMGFSKELGESGEIGGCRRPCGARNTPSVIGARPFPARTTLAWSAVRAHLLELAGDHQAAIAHFRTAAGRTTSVPERNYLITQAARLSERVTSAASAKPAC